MIRSLSTAVSGLRGYQIKLDVIGNNIANVNTVAFKKSQARFEDLLSETIQSATAPLVRGGINPSQVGTGIQVSSIMDHHDQGAMQTTDRDTDLAIEGAGFFVVFDGQQLYFTRDGSFGRDANGELVNVNGLKLMGYIGRDTDATGELSSLHIPLGEQMVARASENLYFSGNLDAGAREMMPEIQVLYLGNATGGSFTLSNGTFNETLNFDADIDAITDALEDFYGSGMVTVTDDGAGGFEIAFDPVVGKSGLIFDGSDLDDATEEPGLDEKQSFKVADCRHYEYDVFDSLGRRYLVEFVFTPAGGNTWAYEATLEGGAISIGGGILAFDTKGYIDQSASNIGPLSYTPPGADTLNVMLDFSKATQLAGSSNLLVREQDGFTAGELVAFSIGRTGVITGTYSNGMVEQLGQLALAYFANPEGLLKEGGNLYQITANSGEARIGAAGVDGRGMVQSYSLEMSNADLSFEFTELITTSRAFQANTRVITTSDEVLQEVINMKR